MVRQLADEAHRVGQQRHLPVGAHHLAGGGVECGEQAVLDEHLRAGERVEERALAGVGVADDGRAELAAPPAALCLALALDRLQLALEPGDALAHDAAVGLELGLARTARADAARLALQVLPHAGEPRQRVLELRQLHLQPRLARARAAGEDVEDQLRAIHHLAPERLLEVAHLGGREVVVEDDHVGIQRFDPRLDLLELALADEGGRMHGAALLHDRVEHARPGGVGEPRQLLKRAREVGVPPAAMARGLTTWCRTFKRPA